MRHRAEPNLPTHDQPEPATVVDLDTGQERELSEHELHRLRFAVNARARAIVRTVAHA